MLKIIQLEVRNLLRTGWKYVTIILSWRTSELFALVLLVRLTLNFYVIRYIIN